MGELDYNNIQLIEVEQKEFERLTLSDIIPSSKIKLISPFFHIDFTKALLEREAKTVYVVIEGVVEDGDYEIEGMDREKFSFVLGVFIKTLELSGIEEALVYAYKNGIEVDTIDSFLEICFGDGEKKLSNESIEEQADALVEEWLM